MKNENLYIFSKYNWQCIIYLIITYLKTALFHIIYVVPIVCIYQLFLQDWWKLYLCIKELLYCINFVLFFCLPWFKIKILIQCYIEIYDNQCIEILYVNILLFHEGDIQLILCYQTSVYIYIWNKNKIIIFKYGSWE